LTHGHFLRGCSPIHLRLGLHFKALSSASPMRLLDRSRSTACLASLQHLKEHRRLSLSISIQWPRIGGHGSSIFAAEISKPNPPAAPAPKLSDQAPSRALASLPERTPPRIPRFRRETHRPVDVDLLMGPGWSRRSGCSEAGAIGPAWIESIAGT